MVNRILLNFILISTTVIAWAQSDGGNRNSVNIEYIGHACFILEANESRIMIDPYADRVWLGYDFPKDIEVDAVFITHPHYDHDGGIFRGMKPDWMFNTPFYQNPKEYEIGDFRVKGIVGKHADPYGKEFGQMNTVWKIEINGIILAHWGDNAPLTKGLADELKDIDILFMPMDGDFHIIPKQAYTEALDAIRPRIIVPMHYRIPELEKDTDSPSDLGEINPFLAQRPKMYSKDLTSSYLPEVQFLESNKMDLVKDLLGSKTKYLIFKHSPLIPTRR